jgi:glycosyltransferase involved in cell wall biosynthesis
MARNQRINEEQSMPERDSLPRVSIIIPTYNRSKLLQLTVESVLNQTYPALEVIVVDDGSKDDTEKVMQKYAGRVTYIKQANRGVSAARNTGFRVSSGQYINFLDDDDLFMPTKIERQVQMLEARPEAGLVHCRYYYVDENANPIDKVGLLPEREVLKKLVCGCFLWSGAPLIRRQCLERVGGFDEETESSCEEWDLWLRVAQAGHPFACVQDPLGAYRIVSGSRMVSNLARYKHGVIAALDRVFADAQLPAEVVAVKEQAYSNNHIEIGCRYYSAGRWDEAQRSLATAVTLRPYLLENPEEFLQLLYFGALDVRTADPVQFAKDVFDHLPAGAEGLRPYRSRFLGKICAGVALRDYGFGSVSQAQQRLAEALTLYPQWLGQPEDLLELICDTALGSHIDDAVNFLARVFDHLPSCAEGLRLHYSRLLGRVYVGLALRGYGSGNIPEAKDRLAQAIAFNSTLLDQTKDFERLLCNYAMDMAPSTPILFVETVFQNLPASAQPLARIRARVLSEVGIACAFEDYAAGQRRSVARRVFAELRRHPSWLRNRGVISIFLRSLPSLMAGQDDVWLMVASLIVTAGVGLQA